jgi:hypothetical protein
LAKNYFGKARMTQAFGIVLGIGGSAVAKQVISRMVAQPVFDRVYGILSIIAGATLNMRGRKPMVKSAGTGMVVYGVLDLAVSNIPALAQFLPAVAVPSAFLPQTTEAVSGGMTYGRSMMGGNISSDRMPEVVGASISSGSDIEVVGDDYDLADMLEMSV